jgi:ABC-2 type transport system ATP-binding protein
MPEAAPLYPEMRVREYLRFRAELKGVRRRERSDAVERAMKAAAVADVAETLISHLSKGYRQRVGLADALVNRPPLLILDEPTAGLDPNQIREVRKLIRELGDGHTILLSTHILSEVETTCDRAIVIDRGRLVAEGTIDELKRRRRAGGATLHVHDPEGRARQVLGDVAGISTVALEAMLDEPALQRVSISYSESTDAAVLEAAVTALVRAGIGVREAVPSKASLEDVFAQLTLAEAVERAEGAEA